MAATHKSIIRLFMTASLMATLAATTAAQPAAADAVAQLGTYSVDAQDNIFGAGHANPPDPVGTGGGLQPVSIALPAGAAGQILTANSVNGSVSCDGGGVYDGPDGAPGGGSTNVSSYGGIASSVLPFDPSRCPMPLMGVFTSKTEPADPSPPRLAFISPGRENQLSYSPQVDQSFFIGDGLTGTGTGSVQKFVVPTGATTIWLGFIDGQDFSSPLGYYNDNEGSISASLSLGNSPVASLDAGTFVALDWRQGAAGATDCTTGFGAHDSNGTSYELGAKHCVNGDVASRNNNSLSKYSPTRVSFYNPVADMRGSVLADALPCTTGSTSTCLVPKPSSETGDFFSWKPDLSVPSSRVQTQMGLLPVLGSEPTSALTPGTTVICHYGAGSAKDGQAQRCGTLLSAQQTKDLCKTYACDVGVVYAAMYGTGGDSGGPVYDLNNSTGQSGAIAVGITLVVGQYCQSKGNCTPVTGFVPIDKVLTRLHLTLNAVSAT